MVDVWPAEPALVLPTARLLAKRGARLSAIDIAEVFIAHAREAEQQTPLGIDYRVASAVALPFEDATFDFATGFMSFMDVPETARVLAEAYRVLKPGGFLQFSITHPCFDTPHRRNLRDASGRTYALEVGDYFRNLQGDVTEWLFSAAPPRFPSRSARRMRRAQRIRENRFGSRISPTRTFSPIAI